MMDDDTRLIDKVARAIATADEQNGGPPYDLLMTMAKHVRENLDDRARAAVVAVRDHLEAYLTYDEEGAVAWIDKQLRSPTEE